MAVAENVTPALKDLRAAATHVVDARLEEREDSSGRPALFVVLVLADPPAGKPTWPVDDVIRIRRMVRDRLEERAPELDVPWFVEFESEHPDVLDPADASDQIEIDN